MAQAGFTPISLYYSTTASAVPTAGNLVAGELALNTNDGKLYYKNSSNVVTLLASTSGASGDVVGPASATANGVALFDGTTGKLLQSPSTITYASSTLTLPSISASGNLGFTGTGNRITGDMSNATIASRLMFQNSTTDAVTVISAIPNGTATQTNLEIYNKSDPNGSNNPSLGQLLINSSEVSVRSTIRGSGTYLPLTMYTGGSERLRIDTSGNVGIGTSSPTFTAGGGLQISNATQANLRLSDTTNAAYNFDLFINDADGYLYNRTSGFMAFGTNNTERMRIDSSGKIGINGTPQTGVSAQVEVLQVLGTDGATSTAAVKRYSADTASPNLRTYKSRASSIGTDTIVQSGDGVGAWTGYGYDGSAYINAALIRMDVDGTPGANDMPGRITFNTTADGASTLTERMRIDSSGNVGIGTTTPTAQLQVAGSSSVAALKVPNMKEVATISATAATGTINYDITTQSVLYYTSNASANWTVNFRASSGTSLDTLMSTGESMSVSFLVTQGATAYYNSSVQVDGTTSGVTTKWQGSAPTSGNANSIDSYTYVIIKTASATFTVLAAQTKFA